MSSNFYCGYMAMSSLTYNPGFSVEFFAQPIILKQQWTNEEISIFSNSSNLEWRTGLLDIFLKGTHRRTIPARFSVIWFSGFREDLNMICCY
jgi:hypothetical protein